MKSNIKKSRKKKKHSLIRHGKRKTLDNILRDPSKKFKQGRLLKVPDQYGGFLPTLIAILAGIASGAAAITNAVTQKKKYNEFKRHNQVLEESILKGKGFVSKN